MLKRLILVIFASGILMADAFDVGGVFLTIFPGARATGLGAAFSSVADDATASYYNPGALSEFKHAEFSFIHAPWLRGLASDMYYEFLGWVFPAGSGVIGGHIIYSTYGVFKAINDRRELCGEFQPYETAIELAYGFKLKPNLGVGVNAKFIHSFLAPPEVLECASQGEIQSGGSATSFALGGGLLYSLVNGKLKIAAVIDNLGPPLVYTEGGDKNELPRLVRFGVSYRPFWSKMHKLLVTFDVNKIIVGITKDYEEKGLSWIIDEAWKHMGIEYTFFDMVSLRAGYFYDKFGWRKGITFGGGVRFKNFQLDFADDSKIYDFDQSSNTRFSITYILK